MTPRLRAWVSSWRFALRLGRRDAARARGRSVLVLVMIALPVLAVTAADVLIRTSSISLEEKLDRHVGTRAEALVTVSPGGVGQDLRQSVDPSSSVAEGAASGRPATWADVATVLGDRPRTELRRGWLEVTTDAGLGIAEVTELDADHPLADGLYTLTDGRWPTRPGEAVVNAALAERGPGLGEQVEVAGAADRSATVVGIAESAQYRTDSVVVAPPGTFVTGPGPAEGGTAGILETGWLVGGGPITWEHVLRLNQVGALAFSRTVVADPPPVDPAEFGAESTSAAILAIVAMIAVMALLEVVLLAGPAFAVGAKRQGRTLGLLAASGAEPPQLRRTVLATSVVLGSLGAVAGVVLGIAAGWAGRPLAQRFSGEYLGPFEVPWWHLGVIAGFGLASAVVAAVVPAWTAARQDVVAVLGGRRADARSSRRSPVAGVVLLAGGVAAAAGGVVLGSDLGAVLIAASALLSVLGMVLVVPLLVAGLGRTAGRLPLRLRFAVRDASRHRTRTVPAVAAVAATVAAAVTLGIAVASDEAANEAAYTPQLPDGHARISFTGTDADGRAAVRRVVARYAPDVDAQVLRVVPDFPEPDDWSTSLVTRFLRPDGAEVMRDASTWDAGSVTVSNGDAVRQFGEVPPSQRQRAAAVLAEGGVVVFTSSPADTALTRLEVVHLRLTDDGTEQVRGRAEVPALLVDVGRQQAYGQGIISPQVARELGAPVVPGELRLGPGIDADAEQDLTEALAEEVPAAQLYVERGYRTDSSVLILQLVLAAAAALLMIGGTLTATFLALADARPDLATLAAVGAAPRVRRGIAAAYALAIAVLGALLGAVIGLVPGIALTYPLTANEWSPDGSGTHTVEVPWLLLVALVVGLPALAAGLVALFTRSRLPMVARVG